MKSKPRLPAVTLILSFIGLVVSIYLSAQHYASSSASFCDFGEHVSCSLVNKSVYSEIFGIPVALLGVFWFAAAFFLSWLALRKTPKAPLLLLLWSLLGTAFVFYLVYLEFMLQSVCPFCFLVQIIVLSMLIMSFVIHQKQ